MASAPCSIRPILSSERRAARQSASLAARRRATPFSSLSTGASARVGSTPAEVLRVHDWWMTLRTT